MTDSLYCTLETNPALQMNYHLKNANVSTHKTEIVSQTLKTNLRLPNGKGTGEGYIRNTGITDKNYYIQNT